MDIKRVFFLLCLFVFINSGVSGYNLESNGQITGWINIFNKTFEDNTYGFRFLPEVSLSKQLADREKIEAYFSLNFNSNTEFNNFAGLSNNFEVVPYRAYLGYFEEQFEVRAGLQKINFGSARILRSLMWFDRISPVDPFSITDGVNSLLLRKYFLNNSNLWFWLIFDDKIKGTEVYKNEKNSFEYGLRHQFPFYKGEMGLSCDSRVIDKNDYFLKTNAHLYDGREEKIGVDGSFDVGPGVWFEFDVERLKVKDDLQIYNEKVTAGIDYTFKYGINIAFENFIMSGGSDIKDMKNMLEVSSVALNYSPDIINRFGSMIFYIHSLENFISFLTLQKTYDMYQINIILFSNSIDNYSGLYSLNGNGVQLMLTYNY